MKKESTQELQKATRAKKFNKEGLTTLHQYIDVGL